MVDESVEADKVKETKKVRAVEPVISLCHSVTTSDRFHVAKTLLLIRYVGVHQ